MEDRQPNWWGFFTQDGSYDVMYFFHQEEIDRFRDHPGILRIVEPFYAKDRLEAWKIISHIERYEEALEILKSET